MASGEGRSMSGRVSRFTDGHQLQGGRGHDPEGASRTFSDRQSARRAPQQGADAFTARAKFRNRNYDGYRITPLLPAQDCCSSQLRAHPRIHARLLDDGSHCAATGDVAGRGSGSGRLSSLANRCGPTSAHFYPAAQPWGQPRGCGGLWPARLPAATSYRSNFAGYELRNSF